MGDSPIFYFSKPGAVAAISAGVVITAFLINRFAPRKRKHVRRAVILALFYLAAFVALLTLSALHVDGPAHAAREITELIGVISVVSLAALTVFDLALPAIGVDAAPIVTDIVVGIGYLAAGIVTMRRAGFDFSGIVATSALLTTITAFSLQNTLSNVVGGVALQVDDSIKVGDWVQLENGKQGRVREIRWRYTVLETRDWDTMIVPNATILSSTLLILGKREGEPLQHRVWIYFNVDFRFSPADVIIAVNEALQAAAIEGVAATPAPHALVMDFAKDNRDSFAYYAVRYWLTELSREDPTSSRVRERIYTALKRAGIPLAVPAAHLWVEADNAEHRDRKKANELARRIKALGAVDLFENLRPEETSSIAEGLRYALFAPGEPMTRQGAVAHWLYIVMDGSAEVRVNVGGQEKIVAKIVAPGFFGEMGLMTGEPRTATVVAVTEVECYRLDKAAFHRIITERPELAKEISELLAHRRVELHAVKEGLDAAAKARRLAAENVRILATVQRFFGLSDYEGPKEI
jgi:small-conductance mechanosensitive channel/CRP-like cAMP-binding protein